MKKTGKKASSILLALLMTSSVLFGSSLSLNVSAAADANTGPNLALNKTAASSSDSGTYTAASAFDGSLTTRWASASSDPGWLSVDLGEVTRISRVILNWEAAYGRTYWIQVSNDNVNWTIAADRFFTSGGVDDIWFAPVSARYVRMFGTSRATGYGYSLYEFEVYGVMDSAAGKTASASSNAANAAALTDGSAATAWTSAGKSGENFGVDLGAKLRVGSVRINWGADYASAYTIQVSGDGTAWSDAYSTAAGKGGVETINLAPLTPSHFSQQNGVNPATAGSNPSDGCKDVSVQTVSAEYVRVVPAAGPGADFSVNALEVYGNPWTLAPDTPNAKATVGKLDLDGGWKQARAPDVTASPSVVSSNGFDVSGSKWINAAVPGTVLSSYYKDGLIPDPYYSDNMGKLSQWYYNVDYWYRNEFTLPANYAGQRIMLNFEGINWFSDVYVNGQIVGSTDGPFKREEFDVSACLTPGQTNTIAVNVHIFPTLTPGGGSPQQSVYAPQFISSGAWDWIPAIPGRNVGIVKDVSLTTRNSVAVKTPYVTTTLPLPDTSYADVGVQANLVNTGSQPADGVIMGVINPGNITFQQTVSVPANSTVPVSLDHTALSQLRMQNPILWMPNGYGSQFMYTMSLAYSINGFISDSTSFNFGVRQYTYDWTGGTIAYGASGYSTDPAAKNLVISCNGVKIMCKGGNWGMTDAMLGWTAADYDLAAKMHADMNFTMIRSWTNNCDFDAFYDACDKYGIMVFSDFPMHGNFTPEALGYYIRNVQDKLERDRNHPSIAVWCGANEGTPGGYTSVIEPELCQQLDPTRLWIVQSNADQVRGGVTYSVQDPKWYFNLASTHTGFTTEAGTPVLPNYESMEEMMPQQWWWPPTDPTNPLGKPINYMWQYHDMGGLADIGNKGAANYLAAIDNRYGASAGIEEYSLKAQMINLETNRAMFESWNNYMWNKCSGLLLWMSQSAWPSTIWQTYDKYWDSNGAYFGCKHACEPIHVQWNVNNSDVKVINNTADALPNLNVTTAVYNMDGTLFSSTDTAVSAAADSAAQVTNIAAILSDAALSQVNFIRLTLTDADSGKVLSSNFYWRNKNGTANYTAMDALPQVQLTAVADTADDNGVTHMAVTLTNNTSTVAVMTRLKVMRGDTGTRVLPVFYDDNYFAMLPGETKVVNIRFNTADAAGTVPVLRMEGFNTAPAVITGTGASASTIELATKAQLSSNTQNDCADVQAVVSNYTDSSRNVTVYAAVYGANGAIISLASTVVTVAARSSAVTPWFCAMDTGADASVCTLKVFGWDAAGFAPLCAASTPKIQPAGTYQ